LILNSIPYFSPASFVSKFWLQAPPFAKQSFSQLLDTIAYRHQDNLFRTFGIFIIILTISAVFYFLQTQFSRILDTKLQSQLRIMFIDKVSHLDYQHLEGKKSAILFPKLTKNLVGASAKAFKISAIFLVI